MLIYSYRDWTFQDVTINNCQVGFDITTGTIDGTSQGVGAEAIIDVSVTNTPVFLRSSTATTSLDGSLVLNNIAMSGVTTAVGLTDGTVILAGSSNIDTWVQGYAARYYFLLVFVAHSACRNVYSGSSSTGAFTQGTTTSINKPSVLLDSSGKIFGKGRPTYADYAVDQFISVKEQGAVGDGETDDTAALQAVFDNVRFFFYSIQIYPLIAVACASVCRMQDHIFRRWNLYCVFDAQDPRRCSNSRRGLDCKSSIYW